MWYLWSYRFYHCNTANEICKFSVSEASVMNILIFEPVLRVLLLSCRFCRAQMTHCVNGNSTTEESHRARSSVVRMFVFMVDFLRFRRDRKSEFWVPVKDNAMISIRFSGQFVRNIGPWLDMTQRQDSSSRRWRATCELPSRGRRRHEGSGDDERSCLCLWA